MTTLFSNLSVQHFIKQPGESYTIAIEFTGRLPSGAALSSGTVSATDSSGNDATGTVLASPTLTISGTQAKVRIQAGTHGQLYRLRFLVTLDNADVLEEDLDMEVSNL